VTANHSLSVLLVEDNPGDATLIERQLALADTTILGADVGLSHVETLDDAFGQLRDSGVDVVLLDLGLSKSSGLSTLERLLDGTEDEVPVVVLTGLDANDAAVEAIQRGAQDYLTKGDFDGDLLVRTIRYAIERKDNERAIQRQNDRLEQFASVLSHDLRNPLNVAMGRLAAERKTHDSEHLEEVEAMHDRMETLIEDVLVLARQGRHIGDTEPVALGAVAEDAWAAIDGGGDLAVADAPTVAADRERVRALFENLFRNAVEHSADTPTVRVGRLGDDDRSFFVADDGPGIPADKRGAVFEHGFTTAQDGTGFGLSIVAEIARAHGWTVDATESDAGGARFEFTVPAQAGPDA
jgi:signal transduction histidine kinase